MADPGYRWSDGHPQRRAAWADHLRTVGPVRCGCTGQCLTHTGEQCPVLITDGDDWHLGHGLSLAEGGDGADSTPWCPLCNLRGAAAITNGKTTEPTRYDW